MSTSDADRRLVDALDEVWSSIAALGDSLTDGEWAAETECPGWSVKDNLAHVIGIESLILGRERPEHSAPDAPHVKNDLGRDNEVWVDWYRARPASTVLADFRAITAERLTQLLAVGFDFGAQTWTPVGPGEVRDQLPFRVFDSWVHEQDMRRAVDRPGGWDGAGARITMERIVGLLPMLVAKQAGAPDGSVVVVAVEGPIADVVAIAVEGGRGRRLAAAPEAATVRLSMSAETLLRLATGRGDAGAIVTADVRVEGDGELGARVARSLNFLF